MEQLNNDSTPSFQVRINDAKQALLLRLEESKNRISELNAFRFSDIDTGISLSPLFQSHRDEASHFGYSLRSFLLYGQQGDGISRSPGLFVERGHTSFAIGLFLKDGIISAHLIAPHGADWAQDIVTFSKRLMDARLVDRIYVRHITESAANALRTYGFRDIDHTTSWCDGAPLEDETFNHRLVDLDAIVTFDEMGGLSVKDIEGTASKEFRKKFRLAYQRGGNFLSRNGLVCTMRPYTSSDLPAVTELVRDHFGILEQSGKAIGSCALDYAPLLKNHLPDDERYVSLVCELQTQGSALITSVFLGERIGSDTGGL